MSMLRFSNPGTESSSTDFVDETDDPVNDTLRSSMAITSTLSHNRSLPSLPSHNTSLTTFATPSRAAQWRETNLHATNQYHSNTHHTQHVHTTGAAVATATPARSAATHAYNALATPEQRLDYVFNKCRDKAYSPHMYAALPHFPDPAPRGLFDELTGGIKHAPTIIRPAAAGNRALPGTAGHVPNMMNNRRLGLLMDEEPPEMKVILRDEEKFDTAPSSELLAWADRANHAWADRRKQRWHHQRSLHGIPYMDESYELAATPAVRDRRRPVTSQGVTSMMTNGHTTYVRNQTERFAVNGAHTIERDERASLARTVPLRLMKESASATSVANQPTSPARALSQAIAARNTGHDHVSSPQQSLKGGAGSDSPGVVASSGQTSISLGVIRRTHSIRSHQSSQSDDESKEGDDEKQDDDGDTMSHDDSVSSSIADTPSSVAWPRPDAPAVINRTRRDHHRQAAASMVASTAAITVKSPATNTTRLWSDTVAQLDRVTSQQVAMEEARAAEEEAKELDPAMLLDPERAAAVTAARSRAASAKSRDTSPSATQRQRRKSRKSKSRSSGSKRAITNETNGTTTDGDKDGKSRSASRRRRRKSSGKRVRPTSGHSVGGWGEPSTTISSGRRSVVKHDEENKDENESGMSTAATSYRPSTTSSSIGSSRASSAGLVKKAKPKSASKKQPTHAKKKSLATSLSATSLHHPTTDDTAHGHAS